jgi:hypothetical protein
VLGHDDQAMPGTGPGTFGDDGVGRRGVVEDLHSQAAAQSRNQRSESLGVERWAGVGGGRHGH